MGHGVQNGPPPEPAPKGEPCPHRIGAPDLPIPRLLIGWPTGRRSRHAQHLQVAGGGRHVDETRPETGDEAGPSPPASSPNPTSPQPADEEEPITLRSPPPSYQLPPSSREPVPVVEVADAQPKRRRTRRDGPLPKKPCEVCTQSFQPKTEKQRCCDRVCGGVLRQRGYQTMTMAERLERAQLRGSIKP